MLAGVLGALRMQQRPPEDIRELRVICVGAGSAGVGVSRALHSAMVEAGGNPQRMAGNFYVVDEHGLVGKSRYAVIMNSPRA